MHAVVLTFESLAARSIGCYGNEWIETPGLDRLAATGVVFDLHFADAIDHRAGLAWVTGRAASEQSSTNDAQSLGENLRRAGIKTRLISATEFPAWQEQARFDQCQIVNGQTGPDAEPSSVPIAELVKAGLAAWNDPTVQGENRLLWLHARAPGDPPKGFDSLYFEDFEERGQAIDQLSDEERQQHPAMYGGSVSLIDHWLGELIAGLDRGSESGPTLFVVTAARGHIWQHVRTPVDHAPLKNRPSLTDQSIQTPLILKWMNDDRLASYQSQRSDRLTQSQDLMTTLLEWFGCPACSTATGRSYLQELIGEAAGRSELRVINGEHALAVRTPHWLAIRETNHQEKSNIPDTQASPLLYRKPEDVWDINDVAAQNPEIVSKLIAPLT